MKRPGKVMGMMLAAAIALLFLLPTAAQETSLRIILKDGSYQLVTKYEVKGDRVHYFSAEREEWEDLPSSLVDWPATNKYEKERAAGVAAPEAVQFDKESEAQRAAEDAAAAATQPEVARGLRLPDDSGVFLLDSFQGEPQLDEIQQNASDVDRNTKTSIFRGVIPGAGAKASILLDGAHAAVQAHVDVPSLYINVEDSPGQVDQQRISLDAPRSSQSSGQSSGQSQQPQQPEQPEQAIVPFDRFRLVQTEVKGNKRIVGDVKRGVTGKVSQEQHSVKTTITQVHGGWLKVTPTESLPPGEYALVEIMGKEGMNLEVWDFGVNPKAPANAKPYTPETKTSTVTPAAPAKPEPNE